jgi:hypothetical protein
MLLSASAALVHRASLYDSSFSSTRWLCERECSPQESLPGLMKGQKMSGIVHIANLYKQAVTLQHYCLEE